MAVLSGFGQSWTAISTPTATAEIWQCTNGVVEITAESTPGTYDGIRLTSGMGVPVSSGKTISYRRVGSAPATIRREAI